MADKRPRGRLTQKVVEEALRNNAGVQSAAAQALGVHRSQICRMVRNNQKLQLVIAEITDEMNDTAEGQLMLAIRRGESWAIKYWLDNRGQERGFGVRKLAFKDQDGQMVVPAVLLTEGRMSPSEWEAKFGTQPAASPAE